MRKPLKRPGNARYERRSTMASCRRSSDVIHDAYASVAALAAGYLELAPATADFERRRLLSELHRRVREILRGSLPPAEVSAALRRLDATSDALAAYQG